MLGELGFKWWEVLNTGVHRQISTVLYVAIVLFNS